MNALAKLAPPSQHPHAVTEAGEGAPLSLSGGGSPAMADLARRRAACQRFLADIPAVPEREPFTLTAAQFEHLSSIEPGYRDLQLGILAHAHEYRQRQLQTGRGVAWLLSGKQELDLAEQWAGIREDRTNEARRVFVGMMQRESA